MPAQCKCILHRYCCKLLVAWHPADIVVSGSNACWLCKRASCKFVIGALVEGAWRVWNLQEPEGCMDAACCYMTAS